QEEAALREAFKDANFSDDTMDKLKIGGVSVRVEDVKKFLNERANIVANVSTQKAILGSQTYTNAEAGTSFNTTNAEAPTNYTQSGDVAISGDVWTLDGKNMYPITLIDGSKTNVAEDQLHFYGLGIPKIPTTVQNNYSDTLTPDIPNLTRNLKDSNTDQKQQEVQYFPEQQEALLAEILGTQNIPDNLQAPSNRGESDKEVPKLSSLISLTETEYNQEVQKLGRKIHNTDFVEGVISPKTQAAIAKYAIDNYTQISFSNYGSIKAHLLNNPHISDALFRHVLQNTYTDYIIETDYNKISSSRARMILSKFPKRIVVNGKWGGREYQRAEKSIATLRKKAGY
ncbi:hypothetical protein N9J72_03130, partial [Candidatus Gracilibacteria bacterium]|nr:hypothetical protein [Candidatus Gracilibacteria bacterium]